MLKACCICFWSRGNYLKHLMFGSINIFCVLLDYSHLRLRGHGGATIYCEVPVDPNY